MKPSLTAIKPWKIKSCAPFLFRYPLCGETANHRKTDVSLDPPPGKASIIKPVNLLDARKEIIILDGHRRVSYAYEKGLNEIAAIIYPAETPKETVLHLALSALQIKETSALEKIIALYKCALFEASKPSPEKIPVPGILVSQVSPLILSYAEKILERKISEKLLLKLFLSLAFSSEELHYVHTINLRIEQLIPVLELTNEERLWILKQKSSIPITAAEFRKLALLLVLARARRTSDFSEWIEEIVCKAKSPATGKSLLAAITAGIRPKLVAKEKQISSVIREMRLPTSLRINPPENLEGNSFSCYFSFSTEDEFDRLLEVLMRAKEDKKIKEIINLLNSCSEENKRE